MRSPAQANLFTSGGEIAVDAALRTATRTALDAHSWVEVVPFWLTGADALFERLSADVPWKEHYRRLFEQVFLEPRLTAEYGRMEDAPRRWRRWRTSFRGTIACATTACG